MNWWTAAAWCRANDLHLATMYEEMCPSWDGNTFCSELNGVGSGIVWSSTAIKDKWAYYVNLSSGYAGGWERQGREGSGVAFCR